MPRNKRIDREDPLRADGGQLIALVALLLVVLFGMVGLVVDFGWYQLNLVKVQRAADAAALAGTVYLPGNVGGASAAALVASTQAGYSNGSGGVVVSTGVDPTNPQMLNVAVTAPVRTWFMRLFGVNQLTVSRNARAEFILPVPMGSPQSYLGVSKPCDGAGSCSNVPSATGSGTLASQGFWAAVLTKGSNRKSGDAYSAYYNPSPTVNASYDPGGYSYIVDFPAGTTGGTVWLFDAGFCADGHSAAGAYLGTGDHWLNSGNQAVTTEYSLWDMNGTPYSTSDDILLFDSGSTFTSMNAVDKGPSYGGNQVYSDSGGYDGGSSSDCQSSPYHNAWWQFASGLGAGQYRLQVKTSNSLNDTVNAENAFGLQVTSSGGSGGRVYGQSRMAVYVNLPAAGVSSFYLAQVGPVNAGKTMEIKLFDPGDTPSTTLRIKQPTAAGYTDATFSFTAVGGTGPSSGTNLTSLVTSNGSGNLYDNAWVTIDVVLSTSYSAPTPPGEPGPGWWKIEYDVGAAGNDTTTWSVNIRGNPVHLVTP